MQNIDYVTIEDHPTASEAQNEQIQQPANEKNSSSKIVSQQSQNVTNVSSGEQPLKIARKRPATRSPSQILGSASGSSSSLQTHQTNCPQTNQDIYQQIKSQPLTFLQKKQVQRCIDCNHEGEFAVNRKEGTLVCTNCGIVQQSRIIDESSEWRNFSNEHSSVGAGGSTANRVGGKLNPYMQDFGITTMVKGGGIAAREMQKWSERTQMTSLDKSIQVGHQRINELKHLLSLKDTCVQQAYSLYKKMCDSGKLKGRSIDARVATVIFIASRQVEQPKDIKKILQFCECTHQDLSKCYKQVKLLFPETHARMQASKVAEQAANSLELPMDIVAAVKTTADNLSMLQAMEGKKPQTVAGVAMLMVCKHGKILDSQISVDMISEKVNMGAATIFEVFRQNCALTEHVLPEYFKKTNQ